MMTKERPWIFSIHALSRAASRFNLIVDEKARLEIFKQLNHEPTVVTRHHQRALFEISLFGRKVIVVCEPHKRAIVTLLDAKKWYRNRAIQSRKGKNIPPRHGWNDSKGTEEE